MFGEHTSRRSRLLQRRTIGVVSGTTFFLLPHLLFAAVVINEVAWMGSADSPNDEWIELYNNGDTVVSLDGWTLTDNLSLEIELAGAVGAGEFAVLERTDDSSAPGVATVIYTGSLANDGRTLSLKRSDGGTEDQVAGGENWELIGGNNETKDTAQKTAAGWITAPRTPGKINATTPTPVVVTTSGTQTSARNIAEKKAPEKISLVLPDNELSLAVTAPTVTFVHQPVTFEVAASGIGSNLIESLTYEWNFGDTYTGTGRTITHSFSHPGEYLVIVGATYGRHSARERHEISVLPQSLTLTKKTDKTITITNSAPYEVDISGFVLQGDTRIAFPKNTYLLPNAGVTLDADRIQKGIVKTVALLDMQGSIVALYTPHLASQNTVEPSTTVPYLGNELLVIPEEDLVIEPLTTEDVTVPPVETTEHIVEPVRVINEETSPLSIGTVEAAAVGAMPNTNNENKLPYYGLVAILTIGILALYTTKFPKKP